MSNSTKTKTKNGCRYYLYYYNQLTTYMSKTTKTLAGFLLACLSWSVAMAQNVRVTGNVTDSDGVEVISAGVTVKGKPGTGTVTDAEGNYVIQAQPEDVLVFSCLGMRTAEVPVKGRARIDVRMEPDENWLEEGVAIGYATVKRKDLTGSVTSVSGRELSKVPVSDITQALGGRMAGVQVSQSEGGPGASISIRVRGGISITQSNEPLYVIDGFPTEDGLSSLDPSDIETIDVLKDASATAIYGAQGANGVVVVTTKSGRNNQRATVTFDSYVGVRKLARKLSVLAPYEYVLLDYERSLYREQVLGNADELSAFESNYGKFSDIDANYSGRKGIDWQEETLGRTAVTQNYRVGVSGGTDRTNYAIAYSYFNEQGAMVSSGTWKHNFSASLNTRVNDWLTVNGRVNYDNLYVYGMGTSGDGSSGTGDRFNKLQHILQYRPTKGIKGEDSELLDDEDSLIQNEEGNVMQNPLLSAKEETKNRDYRTLQANGGILVKLPVKGLSFRSTAGMRYQNKRSETFYGDKSVMAKRSSINGNIQYNEAGSFSTSNVLTWNWSGSGHELTVMGGQEYVTRWTRWLEGAADNFPNDEIGLADMSLGLPSLVESSENYDDKLLSFFGRVNWSWQDKYILSASLRADGSSKFGKNNKWGYFPAISGAWRLIDEPWIQDLGVFSDLKLRAGYGLAGNNRISSYQSLALMESVTYPDGNSTQSGYVSKQVPNDNLKWEANKTFNVGLDMGFLGQRITVSPELYINRSSNLLLNAKLPSSSGYSSMMINAGSTENKGIDLTINTVNVSSRDFSWTTALTLSHNVNKVLELTGEQEQYWEANFGYNQNTHRIAVGEALGQFWGYETDGLYQVEDFDWDGSSWTLKDGVAQRTDVTPQPGYWKFKNVDGSADNKVTSDDRTVIGNAQPDVYGGLNNVLTWRDFDLSVFLTYSFGNDVLNATKLTNTKACKKNRNVLSVADMSHRWTLMDESGALITDPATLAAVNAGKTFPSVADAVEGNYNIHSWAVEDGSFVKISNITLGYTLPHKIVQKAGLTRARVYVTGTNLFTFTKYSGYDPEVSTMSSALCPGVDFGAYPRSRSVVFGVNVGF